MCILFDNRGIKKKLFHCDKCGICRVGGRENSFHCDTCGCCLYLSDKDNHVCIKGQLKQDCAICLEDMFTSRRSSHILRCGHCMHVDCLSIHLAKSFQCPLCKKSVVNPKEFEKELDK